MQAPVSFSVFGEPKSKGSLKPFLHPRTRKIIMLPAAKGLRAWEGAIRTEAQKHAEQGVFFGGPIRILVTFTFARPKSVSVKKRAHMTVAPDCSKLVRGVEDAMIGILFRDDSQIVEIHARKVYGATNEPSRLDVTIVELTAADAMLPLKTSPQPELFTYAQTAIR